MCEIVHEDVKKMGAMVKVAISGRGEWRTPRVALTMYGAMDLNF